MVGVEMPWWNRMPAERAQWVLDPLAGVGPLRFGMNSDQVAAALDGAVAHVSQGLGEGMGWGTYSEWGVTGIYGADAGLVAVAIDPMEGPLVRLRGIELIARVPSEVRADLQDLARREGATVRVNWSGDPEIEAWGVSMGAGQEIDLSPGAHGQRQNTVITKALFVSGELAQDPYRSEPVVHWHDISMERPNPGAWPVKAEQDRPYWDWTPVQSIGPLRFGMGPHEVARALGEKPAARLGRYPLGPPWEGPGEWLLRHDWFDRTGVTAHYESGNGHLPALGAVTVDGCTGPQVEFDGIPLIGRPVETVDTSVIQHVEKHGMGLIFGLGGGPGPPDLSMYVEATRAGDTMISGALFGQAEWGMHG
ncbi:hypothetical protein ACIBUY_34170 [Streptomyces sp. NPDC050085]|uniref:hypothetical protein n=1 Tax=Streptomyces sp. NPDC050085 TaxID=3365600 RepID=UPI0037A68B48